jgi:membrane protease YdiL (CAAX protease family)
MMRDTSDALSTPTLAAALVLTALPVALTSLTLRVLGSAPTADPPILRAPYWDFSVYAAANWISFALVLRIIGWRRLHAFGLRVRMNWRRLGAASVAFVAGLGIYGGVTWVLARWSMSSVQGMEFIAPSSVELATLFLSTAITAAFCEEVFFRVLWIGALRTVVPTSWAIVAASVAFAAIHYPYFGAGGVIFISVWATLPIALFLAFGDFTASLVMHAANNAFAYVLVPLLFPAVH